MPKMNKIFPESRELIDLIKNHYWDLYDTTRESDDPSKERISWEELQSNGPAEEFVDGNNYIFIPTPIEGESLRQAYENARFISPCMQFDNSRKYRYMDKRKAIIIDGAPTYLFTRLGVYSYKGMDTITLFTPQSEIPNRPTLVFPFETALESFQKHFKIITSEDYKRGIEPLKIYPRLN
jgi:hypothetical protein